MEEADEDDGANRRATKRRGGEGEHEEAKDAGRNTAGEWDREGIMAA